MKTDLERAGVRSMSGRTRAQPTSTAQCRSPFRLCCRELERAEREEREKEREARKRQERINR